jgi:hypothetical protein
MGGAARHVYGDIPAGAAELGLCSAGAAVRSTEEGVGRRLKVERRKGRGGAPFWTSRKIIHLMLTSVNYCAQETQAIIIHL